HELMDDKMVMNFAFLIDKARQEDFDRKVEELNNRFAEKLNFRCVGPLPPYSFTTLEAKRMRFEEIEEARRRLGLGEEATLSEIKGAHRRLSQEFHPDKGSEQKKFEKITKAYKLLLDYCEGERCSFKKEAVKNFVGIRVLKDIGIQAGG
ncbi:GvpL/GvpF family gas vesicle protein, partial [bacterium]|nr:GvpL/GvpF family gas vesicle protein [bacterium]